MNVLDLIGEGETLLLILILLYLSECLIWVKRESVAFVSAWGGRWRLAVPPSWMGNANGGILFLNPLPPGGTSVPVALVTRFDLAVRHLRL